MAPLTTCDTDDFNRADSTTNPGSTAQGRAWTVDGLNGTGAWGILSNRMYCSAPDTGNRVTVDVEIADFEFDFQMIGLLWPFGLTYGVCVRADPDGRAYEIACNAGTAGIGGPTGCLIVVRRDAGWGGAPVLNTGSVFASGDRVGARVSGRDLYVRHNGVDVGHVVMDAANDGLTTCGGYYDQGSELSPGEHNRWEDFEVCPLPRRGGWSVGQIRIA